MSPPHPDAETSLELTVTELFTALGYSTANLYHETFGPNGSHGRETPADIVLRPRLTAALKKLNKDLPPIAISNAVDELTRDRSAQNLVNANRDIHELLKNGVPVAFRDANGIQQEEKVRVIDWDQPKNNDFFLARQLWVSGELYKRRADLVGFVNGLPLLFIELKASHKQLQLAFKHNLTDYRNTIPQLFWYNAVIILSNGSESRIGSLTADWDHFYDWKKVDREDEQGVISLETMIRGTCEPARLLDLAENFILFSEVRGGTAKLVAQNHQFLGVKTAVERVRQRALAEKTLTPGPSPNGRGETAPNYRGGFQFAGLTERARELRQTGTPAEEITWELLRDRRFIGLKFRRQHQVGNYLADFFCAEHNLIVELDGAVHGTDEKQRHDDLRTKSLEGLGFTVFRINNTVVLETPETFLNKLATACGCTSAMDDGTANLNVNNGLPSTFGRGGGGEGNTGKANSLGVFWHTQGSGKSYSMVFFCQNIIRKIPGNWTFVIVTDRQELDDQIYKTFASTGLVKEKQAQATSAEHLQQLLTEDHRFVFTLIQKFRTERGQRFPKLSDRSDIIVITDEAHRSQYDVFALNMRTALPKAAFIGFTGTPLIAGEEKTREVFGEYVSVYDFKQSIDDGATVPLFYENRIPELQLTNENLNQDMEVLLEEAALDEDQEKKLEREFAREYHLITRDERLETIAGDLVEHFLNRGHMGKAMVVCIDRFTAVRMFDKVREQWIRRIGDLKATLAKTAPGEQAAAIQAKLDYMQATDMAVVISGGQNEEDAFKAKGLDILTHRKRMVKEDLETKFKDPADPFRIVFVCAMWMTGFDVPCCSTIYLDKPMRNHTLMQTIARANRVFPDKNNGLIVDYVGIFRNLQKALAIYGTGGGGDMPVKDKKELVNQLRKTVKQIRDFCRKLGIDFGKIEAASIFQRIKLRDDAVEAILVDVATKKDFLSQANFADRLYKAVLPDQTAHEFDATRGGVLSIAERIRSLGPEVDISEVMGAVEELLDNSIATEGYIIQSGKTEIAHDGEGKNPIIDLSQIDFETLRGLFEKSHKRTMVERLKAQLGQKLAAMVRLNRTRMDFLERFQRLIDEYNTGSLNIELFFTKLTVFTRELSDEEKRGIAENLTEEELAIFDLLTKPDPSLSPKEEADVKKVAKTLLETLKQEKLCLDWRKKQASRAAVRLCVEQLLDQLPRVYTKPLWEKKCDVVYQHVFDSYVGAGESVYAVA